MKALFAVLACCALARAWESVGPYIGRGRAGAGAVSSARPTRIALVYQDDDRPVLYLSGDGGATWVTGNPRLPFHPTALAFDPGRESTLVALARDPYVSSDLGLTWERIAVPVLGTWRGVEFPANVPGRLCLAGTELAAAGSRAVLACSSAAGWRVMACDPGTPSYAASVRTDPGDSLRVVVGGYSGGPCVLITEDGGTGWRRCALPVGAGDEWPREEPPGGGVSAVLVFGPPANALLALTRGQGMFRTTDAGATWQLVVAGDNFTLAGMWGAPGHAAVSVGGAVRRTTDAGATWGRDWLLPDSAAQFLAAVPGSPDVACCAAGPGVYRSENGGWTWTLRGVPGACAVTALARCLDVGSPLYALTDRARLFRMSPGDTWSECPLPPEAAFADVAAGPGAQAWLLAAGGDGPARLFRSGDSGTNWVEADSWLATGGGIAIPAAGMVLAVGTRDSAGTGQLASLLTTDQGATWRRTLHVPGSGRAAAFAADVPGTMLVAGGRGDSAVVLVSADTGRTWTRRDTGVQGAVRAACWSADGASAWCGTSQGAYSSDDLGLSWAYRGLADVRDLTRSGGSYVAATGTGYYLSGDGRSWYEFNYGLSTRDITAVVPGRDWPTDYNYCGTSGSGAFRYWPVGIASDAERRVHAGLPGTRIVSGQFRFEGEDPALLCDVAGRVVARFQPRTREVVALAPGLYFLRGLHGRTLQRVVVVD